MGERVISRIMFYDANVASFFFLFKAREEAKRMKWPPKN